MLQCLMTLVHACCLESLNSPYVLRDTHTAQGPGRKKPDHCFVLPNTASTVMRVQWAHVACTEELKKADGEWPAAELQIHERLLHIYKEQTDEQRTLNAPRAAVGMISNGLVLEVFAYFGAAEGWWRTGKLPFLIPSMQSLLPLGLKCYLGLLRATPEQRNLVLPPCHLRLQENGQLSDLPLLRAGRPGKPHLFTIMPGEWPKKARVVCKIFSDDANFERERTAFALVEDLVTPNVHRARFRADLTQYLADCNPGSRVLITEPLAEETLATEVCTAELFVAACHALAHGLGSLHDAGLCHGDLSLSNLLVCYNAAADTVARVVLNDFGSVHVGGSKVLSEVLCTPLFAAQRVCQSREMASFECYAAQDDWEAAFHVLYAFALSNEEVLHRVGGHRRAPLDKRTWSALAPWAEQYVKIVSKIAARASSAAASAAAAAAAISAAMPVAPKSAVASVTAGARADTAKESSEAQDTGCRYLATCLSVLHPVFELCSDHYESGVSADSFCQQMRQHLASATVRCVRDAAYILPHHIGLPLL